MTSGPATNGSGSAEVQGRLWGQAARDWADVQEVAGRALYVAVIADLKIGQGTELLDVGCGAGMFCQLAVAAGATVSGIDASEAQIKIARERAPSATLQIGEMEHLAYPDASFDVVTLLNSLHYSANPANALREAARVARPDAPVVIGVWDTYEDSEAATYIASLNQFLPAPESGRARLGPLAMSREHVVEDLLREAQLRGAEWRSIDCPFIYADLEEALRGLLSAGPAVEAIDRASLSDVREAVGEAIAPFKTAFGGYRMQNRFRYLVTKAS